MTAINNATSAASRPAMRQATAAIAAIAGSSQSSGHAVNISRSASSGAANKEKNQSVGARPASISRDQCVS